MPVGSVFGVVVGPFTWIGDTFWYPWATTRNRIEAFVGFINYERRNTNLVGYAGAEDKDFFVYVARHGVIRRVGTLEADEPMALYQSKAWRWVN